MTKRAGSRCIALMLMLGGGGLNVVLADSLADPTRPTSEWLAAQPPAPGAEAVAQVAPSGLQVLVLGPTRKFAIIDGQLVRLGETYKGAKLVGFHADGVVMQKDGSKEMLSMSPAAIKKFEVSKPVVGRTKSGKKVVNGEGQ